jgi:arabinan endo-1,5-alpha-L-arabinosidase
MMRRTSRVLVALGAGVVMALGAMTPAAAAPTNPGYFLDAFSSTTLASPWSFVGKDDTAWSLTAPRGSLTLTTRNSSLYEGDNRPVNVVLRDAPSRDYDLITRLRFAPEQDYEQAGLLLWAGQDEYVQLTYSHQGGRAFLAGLEHQRRGSLELVENTVGNDVFLRISRHGDELTFAYSTDALLWTAIGQPVHSTVAYLKVGVFSSSAGSGRAVPASFGYVAATPYLRLPQRPDPALPPDSVAPVVTPTQTQVAYQNPVQAWTSGDPATADPSVARGPDGAYYLVGSESEYSFSQYHALPIFRSTDLVHGTYLRDVFPNPDTYPQWAEDTITDRIDFWAPDISFYKGKVYVYFGATQKSDPANPTNDKAIGVAVADSIDGTFVDSGAPLIKGSTFRAIDQQVFTDSNGKRYIYWGSAFYPILAQRLTDDGLNVVGPVTQVLPSHQGSAYIFDTDKPITGNYENLIEGPWVIKRGSWYYMFYSGPNCCGASANYSVAIARSTTPLGPFEKLENNPILQGDEHVLAPGHNAIVSDDAGQDWIVYHAMDKQANPLGDASRRNLYIDKIEWRDGWPVIHGPTSTPVAAGPVITTTHVGADGPAPVGDLAVGAVTDHSVEIAWTPSSSTLSGYRVYRNGAAVADIAATAMSYTFTGLEACTRGAYSVRPVGAGGVLGDAGGRIERTTDGCPPGTATGRTVDRSTHGTWRGVYGGEGYTLAGDATLAAPGVDVTMPSTPYTWNGSTSEVRATQRADGSGRLAAAWYGDTVPINVSVTDGQAHRVTLYLLDWDGNAGRRESVTVADGQGNVLDTLTAADLGAYDQGTAVTWTVTGDVTITATVAAGANAVVSAVFIDPAA